MWWKCGGSRRGSGRFVRLCMRKPYCTDLGRADTGVGTLYLVKNGFVHLKRPTEYAFGNAWLVRAVLGCEEEIQWGCRRAVSNKKVGPSHESYPRWSTSPRDQDTLSKELPRIGRIHDIANNDNQATFWISIYRSRRVVSLSYKEQFKNAALRLKEILTVNNINSTYHTGSHCRRS